MTCKQCRYITVCMAQADGLGQVFDPNYDGEHGCTDFVPFTNADRIRSMRDEELAELIVKHHPMHAWNKKVREIYFGFDDHRKNNPQRAWLEWLQQPAEPPEV